MSFNAGSPIIMNVVKTGLKLLGSKQEMGIVFLVAVINEGGIILA